MGFRTLSCNECHGSVLILWSYHEPLNAEVSNKEGYHVSELYLMFLHLQFHYSMVCDYNTMLHKPPQIHAHKEYISHTLHS